MGVDDWGVAMRTYNFDKDLTTAKIYEAKWAAYLERLGLPNVELAPEGHFPDWDVRTPGDTYEVKYDKWFERTGNLLIETYSNAQTHSLGWFYHTKADWFVMFINQKEFIVLPMEHIRDQWFDNPNIWRKVKIPQQAGYETICWVAPLEYFWEVKRGCITDV